MNRLDAESPQRGMELLRQRIFGAIFAIVALVTIMLGLNSYFHEVIPADARASTKAIITDIQSHGSGEDITHDISIRYTVNGVDYECLSSYYSSLMRVGQGLEIEYNIYDPTTIVVPEGRRLGVILLSVFGGMFLAMGLWALCSKRVIFDRAEIYFD